jgi:peptide alpha-N-acetyltransferase
MDGDQYVGVIICKLDRHKDRLRGYIAMLAVSKTHRKMSIGSNLVKTAIRAMKSMNADEVSCTISL